MMHFRCYSTFHTPHHQDLISESQSLLACS
nr:MAG TPA: hypothetical protein [Caudoviricetes sp.]